jgi:hypothetical protein
MGLQGADELRRVIGLDEESYLRVAGQSHADVRGYILYTAADEVQKTSIYLMRLREYLQGDAVSPLAGQLDRVMITQVLEDSHTRQRRLVELLTTLVLFSTCNEQDYYRHMLLLEELDGLLSANDDRKEFYGVPSKNVEDSIRHQISWINSVAAKLDSSKMWYVVNGLSLTAPEKLHPGRVSILMPWNLAMVNSPGPSILSMPAAVILKKLVVEGMTVPPGAVKDFSTVSSSTHP